MVANELLNSTVISGRAKLLYVYLISKPHRWSFNIRSIASQMKEGYDWVKSGLTELEDAKLLLRRKIVTNGGKFTGIIYYVANLKDSTISGFTTNGQATNISNTDIRDNIEIAEQLKPTVTIEQRKKKFGDEIRSWMKKAGEKDRELLLEFYRYWTEDTKSGNSFRYEGETYFDIGRRFGTFKKIKAKSNKTNYNKADKPLTDYRNT
jgi:hypothetical protein